MQIISNTDSGIEFELLGNTPCQMTLWSPQQEIPAIKAMDVGLMPLSDSPWMKYKCALKAIQYMALGAVAVCSPVGVNADIIRHGENGYLPKRDEEWFEILEFLVKNRESLEGVREAARRTVEEGFSLEKNSHRWIHLFQEIGEL